MDTSARGLSRTYSRARSCNGQNASSTWITIFTRMYTSFHNSRVMASSSGHIVHTLKVRRMR